MPLPLNPTTRDGRAVADANTVRVLKAVRHFGHLRRAEIAGAVWPKSPASSAYIMACRTVARMVRAGLLLQRYNSLGGESFVLGAKGVARLLDADIVAHEGYDLAFDGPQFFHRTLGTNYLIERAKFGDRVFGEYAILKGWSPLNRDYVRERFSKVPDGLIVVRGEHLGLADDVLAADWVEVESAYKAYDDIEKALATLTRSPELTQDGRLVLNKLVFVLDSRQKHDRQIMRYIRRFLKDRPQLSAEAVLSEIIFARCFIDVPFTWHGMSEISALDFLTEQGGSPADLDNVPSLDPERSDNPY